MEAASNSVSLMNSTCMQSGDGLQVCYFLGARQSGFK